MKTPIHIENELEDAYNALLALDVEDETASVWYHKGKVRESRKRPKGHPTESFRLAGPMETDSWTWDQREAAFRKWLTAKTA